MSKFPKPVSLPKEVIASRANRNRKIVNAVRLGIALRLSVILVELIGVAFIDSSSLFLDAIANFTDVVSSLFLILCMKLAQRPPDHDHPFGHGRYEPMGGMLLGIMLIVLGGVMLVQQGLGFINPEKHHHIHAWAWLYPASAVVVLEIAYRFLIYSAKKIKSPALAADAYHYRIDSLTSLFATAALIIASFWPESSALIDHWGAIAISLFMMGLGGISARENFHQLMDKTPGHEFFFLVQSAALNTSGVEGTEKIRIQRYGPDAHVDIDIEVAPNMTVERAHKISQACALRFKKLGLR